MDALTKRKMGLVAVALNTNEMGNDGHRYTIKTVDELENAAVKRAQVKQSFLRPRANS